MTIEGIIRMAKQAGFADEEIDTCQQIFIHFAKLVAQHEREACAKACEDKAERYAERAAKPENERDINRDTARIAQQTCFHLADNIRARKQA
jgi:hypothetical protein